MLKINAILFLLFLNSLLGEILIYGTGNKGNVGDTICNNIAIESDSNIDNSILLECNFELSNPLVFYPQVLIGNSNFEISRSELTRENDSIYSLLIEIKPNNIENKKINIGLCGELLAGNDSICIVSFYNVKLNNSKIGDFDIKINSNNIGSKFPYLRFAKIQQNAPNPVYAGNITKWAYTVDIAQDINFLVYDLLGRIIFQEKKRIDSPGTHFYYLMIDKLTYAGVYYFKLNGEYSKAGRYFSVIK